MFFFVFNQSVHRLRFNYWFNRATLGVIAYLLEVWGDNQSSENSLHIYISFWQLSENEKAAIFNSCWPPPLNYRLLLQSFLFTFGETERLLNAVKGFYIYYLQTKRITVKTGTYCSRIRYSSDDSDWWLMLTFSTCTSFFLLINQIMTSKK